MLLLLLALLSLSLLPRGGDENDCPSSYEPLTLIDNEEDDDADNSDGSNVVVVAVDDDDVQSS